MKPIKKNSHIFIGIFLILAIATTIFLVQQGILVITRARPTAVPQNIQITNISDASFTVIFTTELDVPAALRLPEGRTGNTIILDDRDKSSGSQNSYFSHHITVPNLNPQQTYSFIIISDGKEYSSPAEYIVTTGQQIESAPPSQNPLYGTVVLPDGARGSDTIVIATSDNSQAISSVTNNNGNYILPTNSLRNEQLNEYHILASESQILLNFFRENYTAKITTDYKLSQNLPSITLNQTYSFFPQQESITQSPQQGFESIQQLTASSLIPTVISPGENQSFIDQRPTFSGTGGENRIANISISSANINQTINISAQGRWTFRPEDNIPQGNHNASFTIQDSSGVNTLISRSFSIFPSGSQVEQSATPSATPTFSPTPTVIITPTSTPSPTPTVVTPEVSSSPTPQEPTSVITPTLIPTNSPTPFPPIDNPGSTSSAVILTVFSIVLIVSGAAIFFAL